MTINTAPPSAPSAPPTAPSRSDAPATFITRADAFIAWFTDLRSSLANFVGWWPTFKSELDATIATINTTAGIGLRYVFSATTTDSDPGPGLLRLSNSTQNLATVVRLDAADANGTNAQGVVDLFDDSTSVNKGYLKLQHALDPSKFLIFNVTAVSSPTGYKNVTASVAASSSANPFADGDGVQVSFVRNGDIATGTVTSADVQNQLSTYFATGGTGTAYTVTPTPAMTAYAEGKRLVLKFVAASGANPTINVSGLGATVNLVKQLADGTIGNVAAGDIPAGHRSGVTFLSATQALVETFPSAGRLIGFQRITSTQPYNPTPGTNSIIVETEGGAGAGGGTPATAAGQIAAGAGGSAGGFAKSRLSIAAAAGAIVTIGAGGAPVSGGNGGNGGTTSFGALLSATGGSGGSAGPALPNTGSFSNIGGGLGGVGSGGNMVNASGQQGALGLYLSSFCVGGNGGASEYGPGGMSTVPSVGQPGLADGAGGSGAAAGPSTAAQPGGAGKGGVCLVWEFA